MDYTFIEIGTSIFDTLIEKATPEDVGLSVEPMAIYLNALPNPSNVTKVNAAIMPEDECPESGVINAYFVHPDVIRRENLGDFMLGCNTMGAPHDFHVQWTPDPTGWHLAKDRNKIPTVNLMERGWVSIVPVPCMSWGTLMETYDIGKIGVLKTDTEGTDGRLLVDILKWYKDHTRQVDLPKTIKFEACSHNDPEELQAAKEALISMGYSVKDISMYDSIAVLNE